MKTIDIRQKLENIGVTLDAISMGDFDCIGEVTAKRQRTPNEENYKKHGAFYRSNYERGILIYSLIRQFNLTSMLEIGFGRGYGTVCAAKAFYDAGVVGKVTTVDPALEEKFVAQLQKVFPQDWFRHITFVKGLSKDAFPQLEQSYDLVYIDGDHSYEGTKLDWEGTKDRFKKFLLFDDYHMPSKDDPGIKCNKLIDEVDESSVGCDEKELILMDRLMFHDDRNMTGRDYGQVLLTKQGVGRDDW